MIVALNYFWSVLLTLSVLSINTYSKIETNSKLTIIKNSSNLENEYKTKAFKILDNKCNVCHRKRNKRRIFSEDNMDNWANDIYKQVFVKKRMPKGNKIKLTTKEYQELLTWISYTKSN